MILASGHDWWVLGLLGGSIHFVDEDVIDHGFGHSQVEPGEQLSEGLSCSAAEHGESMATFSGDSDASSGRHDADDDLAMFDETGDVMKRREVGLLIFDWCVYAARWFASSRLGATCHGSNSSIRLMG